MTLPAWQASQRCCRQANRTLGRSKLALFWFVLVLLCGNDHAAAHVTASVDDNNRFIKLTPVSDRIRMAYTVFYGDKPAMAIRARMDKNRDGKVSDDEASKFAESVGQDLRASLVLSIDGKAGTVAWATIAVGMSNATVDESAFSIDYIAWLCLPTTAQGQHSLSLVDHFSLQNPGITEVKIDNSIGVTLEKSKLGTSEAADHEYKFAGPALALSDTGVSVTFRVGSDSPPIADSLCRSSDASGRPSRGLIALAAAGLAAVVAGGLFVVRRKRRTR